MPTVESDFHQTGAQTISGEVYGMMQGDNGVLNFGKPKVQSNFDTTGAQTITGEVHGWAQGDGTTINMNKVQSQFGS
jgi:hypothetical protein